MKRVAAPDRAQQQRGAVALEFVLLFPFFILVVLGALYFASAFNTQRGLLFAAQSGGDAALRVDRSQFTLPGEAIAYMDRVRAEACPVITAALRRQSRDVAEKLGDSACPEEAAGTDFVSISLDTGQPAILIVIGYEPDWRPPLLGQFVPSISATASVPF
ncbi:pilus assembly protein [Alcanivorax sp. JB21]|uniref:TadE/TadG family type IV pilus assembly protein n=1 Tax=Alcanivorax limicola TaxID=2874102 RepID=UPI001CBE9479|nr:TadE/TadG family type IV pilus assembly protein [Alcanivorax limicola]MBZ2189076.1 pilus assembly protein [Alcanivorax limicola]